MEVRMIVAASGGYNPDESGHALFPLVMDVPEAYVSERYVLEDMCKQMCDLWGDIFVYVKGEGEWPDRMFEIVDWERLKTCRYDFDGKFDVMQVWDNVFRNGRVREFEKLISEKVVNAERYAKALGRDTWKNWTEEEVCRSPVWLFYYARCVCKGRLPDAMDNAMTMLSFKEPDNKWVKRYFNTKRYRTRNLRALAEATGSEYKSRKAV
jgi:hypothetical protein